jgi:hypothetical protein
MCQIRAFRYFWPIHTAAVVGELDPGIDKLAMALGQVTVPNSVVGVSSITGAGTA